GTGRTCTLPKLWYGFSHSVPSGDRRQLEWHHEGKTRSLWPGDGEMTDRHCLSAGHTSRQVRSVQRVSEELLHFAGDRTALLCGLRADGSVRAGERGGGGADETPGGVAQTAGRGRGPRDRHGDCQRDRGRAAGADGGDRTAQQREGSEGAPSANEDGIPAQQLHL